jgi:NitT/TauT family transport system substrate-binding protein
MTLLRYGIAAKTATYWNLYVASDEGCYAAERLEVEPVVTGGTRETIDALHSGQIDLAGCSPDELITAAQHGADLLVVGGIIGRPVSWIIGRPGLGSLADLRGRTIGVNQTRGSVSMVFRAALRAAGLGPDDYQQRSVGTTPVMVEALRRGEVDAAMLTAPFDLALIHEGFRPLQNAADGLPAYAFTTINARRQWVESQPPLLAAFFRATRAAGALIDDPTARQRSLAALAAWTGLSGEALEHTDSLYRQPGVLSRRGEVELAGLEAVARLMAEEGLLAGPVPNLDALLRPAWQSGG